MVTANSPAASGLCTGVSCGLGVASPVALAGVGWMLVPVVDGAEVAGVELGGAMVESALVDEGVESFNGESEAAAGAATGAEDGVERAGLECSRRLWFQRERASATMSRPAANHPQGNG